MKMRISAIMFGCSLGYLLGDSFVNREYLNAVLVVVAYIGVGLREYDRYKQGNGITKELESLKKNIHNLKQVK